MGRKPDIPVRKRAEASLESLMRIFTVPEGEDSTLIGIENEISHNLMGFLREHVVAGELPPAELEKDFLDTEIPEDPVFVSEQADFLLDKVVAQSVHVSSPAFIGHMTSAMPYFMLPLAKIMMALNQNVVKIETSKAFTPLERQVIGMLHRLVYGRDESFYRAEVQNKDESLGAFAAGGTTANVLALWVARNLMFPAAPGFGGIQQEGLSVALESKGLSGLAILISERGHYSFSKIADLLGVGKRHLVSVRTTSDNKIDLAALKSEIAHLRDSRIGVISVVGVGGTTETGTVDPLDAMGDICREAGLRFHVDGSWGAPTLFSRRYKHLLKGIEKADSVILDAHKQLFVPIGAGIALFRNPTDLCSIEQTAQYIIREGSRDLGRHTLEGSRAGMAMLVHSGLRIIGRRGYELLMDLGIEKARDFARMIQKRAEFELVSEPELNLLTYRFVPPSVKRALDAADPAERRRINDQLNELNAALQKAQRAAGRTFVSRTQLNPMRYDRDPVTVLRVVLANPLTTLEILKEILDEQETLGSRLVAEFGPSLETSREKKETTS